MVCNAAYLHGAIELFLLKAGRELCRTVWEQCDRRTASFMTSAGIAGNFQAATRFVASHAPQRRCTGYDGQTDGLVLVLSTLVTYDTQKSYYLLKNSPPPPQKRNKNPHIALIRKSVVFMYFFFGGGGAS